MTPANCDENCASLLKRSSLRRETIGRHEVDSDPELLRGVLPKHLLQNAAQLVRTDAEVYANSFPVKQVDRFLSHSWQAPAVWKAIALLTFFNGTAAAWWSLVVSASVAFLRLSWTCGMWHHPDDVHSTKILVPLGSEISFAGWCTCTHVFVYFVVLLFHQSIRQLLQRNSGQDRGDSQSSALFIDKACIHQTDEQRKKVGVKCIGAFLSRSRRMMIVLDGTYCTRLWCLFEVAVFLRFHKEQELDFVPVSAGLNALRIWVKGFFLVIALLLTFDASLVEAILSSNLHPTNNLIRVTLPTLLCLWLLFSCFVSQLRVRIRERRIVAEQLDYLSVSSAQCSQEADRLHVTSLLEDLYGMITVCDNRLRLVKRTMLHQIGTESLDFGDAMSTVGGVLCAFSMDVVVSAHHAGGRTAWYAFGCAVAAFVQVPTLLQVLSSVARFNVRSRGAKDVASTAVIGAVPVVITTVWLAIFVGVSNMMVAQTACAFVSLAVTISLQRTSDHGWLSSLASHVDQPLREVVGCWLALASSGAQGDRHVFGASKLNTHGRRLTRLGAELCAR